MRAWALPAPTTQRRIPIENLDQLLTGQDTVRRRPPGNKRIIDDDAGRVAKIAMIPAGWAGGISKDELQCIWWRSHIKIQHTITCLNKTRPTFVIVFQAMASDILTSDYTGPLIHVPSES